MDEEKKDEDTQLDPEEKEEGPENKPAEAPEAPPIEEEASEEVEEGSDEEANDDGEKEEKSSDKPKGASMAMISFVLGLVAAGAGVFVFLFRILGVFINNFCFTFCLTGPGACLSGLIGGLSMLAAIIVGIIALVMGAGSKKLFAILGIVLGCSFVIIWGLGVIIALVLDIFI